MFLVSLIYVSQTAPSFQTEDLADILISANKNNGEQQVTGILGFTNNSFIQCLEGSRKSVNKIYTKICNDKRHNNIQLVQYQSIHSRQFSQWSMGYIPDNTFTQHMTQVYSGGNIFNPYEMSGKSIRELLIIYSKIIIKDNKTNT